MTTPGCDVPGSGHTATPQLLGPPTSSGFVLSSVSGPLPAKLVEKARSGQFVEMREFLVDNIRLMDRLESTQSAGLLSLHPFHRPQLREVTSPLTWAYCFMAYVAVRTCDPLARDMLAYARLILGEAQRHGGLGWIDYDRAARQLKAIDPLKPWNSLESGLHSAMILGHSSGKTVHCAYCFESDHSSAQCALAFFKSLPATVQMSQGRVSKEVARNRNQMPYHRPESLSRICASWNKGTCIFPGTCSYRHICATCRGPHMARDCPATPETSEFFRGKSRAVKALASAATSNSGR